MTPDIYPISLFYGIVFLILAIGSAFIGFKLYSKLQLKDRELTDLNFELERVKQKLEQMSAMEANIGLLESKLRDSQNENQSLDKELVIYKTKVNSLKEKSDFFQEATGRLEANFKNLASQLFDEKSRLFKETNNSQIESLLKPFKERLVEFESSIELMHKKASDEKLILSKEIDGLKELNYTMNEETKKLTKALSHEAKVKGNWGELILEKILEGSGLRPGKDFKREVVFRTDEGTKRPDVVIYLPKGRHIVVDSKVSLNAYLKFVNSDSKSEKGYALKELSRTINARVKELSERDYFEIPGLKTPELVLLFLPNEAAFIEVFRDDEGIVQRSMNSNVLITGPSTFLASLNIIRQVWSFEEQNDRTMELIDRARKIYKKCMGFVSSMEDVGRHIDKAKDAHCIAFNQLSQGKGNLVSQLEGIERIGLSVQKQTASRFVKQIEVDGHDEIS